MHETEKPLCPSVLAKHSSVGEHQGSWWHRAPAQKGGNRVNHPQQMEKGERSLQEDG